MSKLPEISTKRGDKGETSQWSGQRVKKNHASMVCVGEFDFFDSAIGLLRSQLISAGHSLAASVELRFKQIEFLRHIQDRLRIFKGEVATDFNCLSKFYEDFDEINQKDLIELEGNCLEIKKVLEAQDYEINVFVIYGDEGVDSAFFDLVRSSCRKCEVALYSLEDSEGQKVSQDLKNYINRLSDYFYWAARLFRK